MGTSILKWENKTKRYVAFLDILGFKDYVLRHSIDDVYSRLNTLYELTPNEIESGDKYKKAIKERVRISIFSDSICVFSINDDYLSLFYFLSYLKTILRRALRKGVPLKGGIAYGDIVVDNDSNIFCGQPIIDAYLLEEDLQYLGVVFHHTFEIVYSELRPDHRKSISKWIKEVETPFKYGMRIHLNLDYRISGDTKYDMRKYIIKQRSYSSGDSRKYVDNTLKMISSFD